MSSTAGSSSLDASASASVIVVYKPRSKAPLRDVTAEIVTLLSGEEPDTEHLQWWVRVGAGERGKLTFGTHNRQHLSLRLPSGVPSLEALSERIEQLRGAAVTGDGPKLELGEGVRMAVRVPGRALLLELEDTAWDGSTAEAEPAARRATPQRAARPPRRATPAWPVAATGPVAAAGAVETGSERAPASPRPPSAKRILRTSIGPPAPTRRCTACARELGPSAPSPRHGSWFCEGCIVSIGDDAAAQFAARAQLRWRAARGGLHSACLSIRHSDDRGESLTRAAVLEALGTGLREVLGENAPLAGRGSWLSGRETSEGAGVWTPLLAAAGLGLVSSRSHGEWLERNVRRIAGADQTTEDLARYVVRLVQVGVGDANLHLGAPFHANLAVLEEEAAEGSSAAATIVAAAQRGFMRHSHGWHNAGPSPRPRGGPPAGVLAGLFVGAFTRRSTADVVEFGPQEWDTLRTTLAALAPWLGLARVPEPVRLRSRRATSGRATRVRSPART